MLTDEAINNSFAYSSKADFSEPFQMPSIEILHKQCAESKKNKLKIEGLGWSSVPIFKTRHLAAQQNLNWADTLQLIVLSLIEHTKNLEMENLILQGRIRHLRLTEPKIKKEKDKKKMSETKGEWLFDGDWIFTKDVERICTVDGCKGNEQNVINGRHIVKCVNLFPELITALEDIATEINEFEPDNAAQHLMTIDNIVMLTLAKVKGEEQKENENNL